MDDTNNPQKPTSRRRDPAITRELLIKSGQSQFNNPGFFSTDTNQIARNAGFAPGTFYQHFKNKTELFLVVQDLWFKGVQEIVARAMEECKTLDEYADFLTPKMIQHFESWNGLRVSLRALSATDPEVRAYRIKKLSEVLEGNNILRKSLGQAPLARVDALTLFNNFERAMDSLIEGDFEAFGVTRPDATQMIKSLVHKINGP